MDNNTLPTPPSGVVVTSTPTPTATPTATATPPENT